MLLSPENCGCRRTVIVGDLWLSASCGCLRAGVDGNLPEPRGVLAKEQMRSKMRHLRGWRLMPRDVLGKEQARTKRRSLGDKRLMVTAMLNKEQLRRTVCDLRGLMLMLRE